MSTGMVTVSRDPEAFASTVAPILTETQSPYICISPSRLSVRLFSAAFAVRRFLRAHGAKYVYVRDPWSALAHQLAFPIGGPDLIYDMRGDVAAEARFSGSSRPKRWVLDKLVSQAVRHASRHVAVSSAGARLMTDKYGASHVNVMPSCVDITRFDRESPERQVIRSRLRLGENDVLIVYSGGSQRYQMLPQMFDIWRLMAANKSVHFLALTNSSDSNENIDLPGDRFTRLSVERDEVPGYLNAADIGFLLRAPHPLNEVASPVKFGEYLASGLTVVSSPGVGDVSRLIEREGLGILVDADQPAQAADASLSLVNELRGDRLVRSQKSRNAARDYYDWESYAAIWKDMLHGDASTSR
jgi:glycosyltransferase involved in cell wall biosynthesis